MMIVDKQIYSALPPIEIPAVSAEHKSEDDTSFANTKTLKQRV